MMVIKPSQASNEPLKVEDNKVSEKPFQMNTHLTRMEKKYAEQTAEFIRPCGWIGAAGLPNSKFEKQHREDWEYVVGIIESKEGITDLDTFEMDWCGWPGDPITTWKVPTKRPVAIPRGVAKAIHEGCKYTAYVVKEREIIKGDKHGDYLTSWKKEEIRNTADFRSVSSL
jgi:hypothetical protein